MATTVRSTMPNKPLVEEGGLSTDCERSHHHAPDQGLVGDPGDAGHSLPGLHIFMTNLTASLVPDCLHGDGEHHQEDPLGSDGSDQSAQAPECLSCPLPSAHLVIV
jgi:hypothetical protein